MDFKDDIKQLSERVPKLKDLAKTEEATKNAFIMPFIKALGYDVFNPMEVVPEFIADIGIKKGEKIDYAIFKDGKPTILIECKHWEQNLNIYDGQLLRYFHVVPEAKFAILTNGVEYRFYSDLVDMNKMDEKPFLEFKISDIKDSQIEELKKFHKSYFDIESIINTASDLKYTNELKILLHAELTNPSAEFVKHFARQVYPNNVGSKILDWFTELTKKSINQYISDVYTDRLKTALAKENEQNAEAEVGADAQENAPEIKNKNIQTTDEELEAFLIIKAILRQKVEVNRIQYRDAQSYFVILLDDNNRKTICRLYLGNKKFIGLFDDSKKENKIELNSIDDIFKYSDQLVMTATSYDIAI
jgi:hypothetical protein